MRKKYYFYGRKSKTRRWRGLLLTVAAVCLFCVSFFAVQYFWSQYDAVPASFPYQGTEAASDSEVIVLDAGHGGSDPGTVWEDVYEKDINLAIAMKVEEILQDAGYTVIMTRTDDSAVYLRERVELAEYHDADAFVSIHQNALENDTVTSEIEVYCNERSNQNSPALASAIHSALLGETGTDDQGVENNSTLFVVRRCSVPACLVETGFLTSASERQLLLSETYQQQLAAGIAAGIQTFLQAEADGV